MTQATNLALWDGEFGQYRWYGLDNVQTTLWLPRTNGRGSLKNMQVPYDIQIPSRDPDLHLTEIFVWEDKVPWFQAQNIMDYGLDNARYIAEGYRFVTTEITDPATLEGIKAGNIQCVYLTCYGQAGRPQ
ncbi:MAG: hypothetical protein GF350_05745 [Chitinivibrionales bacterium]|nr:hypothetical protein [Chitinivibrionales bacterium]